MNDSTPTPCSSQNGGGSFCCFFLLKSLLCAWGASLPCSTSPTKSSSGLHSLMLPKSNSDKLLHLRPSPSPTAKNSSCNSLVFGWFHFAVAAHKNLSDDVAQVLCLQIQGEKPYTDYHSQTQTTIQPSGIKTQIFTLRKGEKKYYRRIDGSTPQITKETSY